MEVLTPRIFTPPEESDLYSLQSFKADYPECEPFLLYRGTEKLLKRGIPCIPCEQFFLGLDPKKKDIVR